MEKEAEVKTSRVPPSVSKGGKTGWLVGWFGRNWPGIVIMLAALAVVVGLSLFLPKRSDDQPAVKPAPTAVRVLEVKAIAEVDDSFRILGCVEPGSIVDVAAEVPGRVEAYAGRDDKVIDRRAIKKGPASAGTVGEGDIIRAGMPILYLNTDLLQADCDRSRADYDFGQRESKRLEQLFAKKVATKAELDVVLKYRDMARASLETCQARLERAIIVAPCSGVLDSLPVDIGEYVQPGTVIAKIVNMNTVKVILHIPERDISYLKVGQEQTIFFGRDDSREVAGEITYISELADENTHTTRMEISVDNRDRLLRSGQMVYAKLRRRTLKNVIMIPLRTIVPLEKGYVAYVSSNGKAHRRKIALDSSMFHGDHIRVEKGLKPGDRLIIEPTIGPGQAIREVTDAAE